MKLEIDKLTFAYGDRPVLKDISFHLERGDFLSVLGPNGVGKSTLFKCILGIIHDYSGTILMDGVDLRGMSPHRLAQLTAYIPQVSRPAFGYTVLDTVLMSTSHSRSPFSMPQKQQIDIAMNALERTGIAHLAERNFSQLSGGEQQLTLIARALAQQSPMLIMDEPTSSLDYGNQLRVLDKVRRLAQDGHIVLLSTHNPQDAITFSNRVLALHDGCVAAFGETKDELTVDLIHRLYGIRTELIRNECGCGIIPTSYA